VTPAQIAVVIFNVNAAIQATRGEVPIAATLYHAPEDYRKGLDAAIRKRIADPEFNIPLVNGDPAVSLQAAMFGSLVDTLKGMTTEPPKVVTDVDMDGDDAPRLVPVKYIGHRATYKDGACGSGLTFKKDETRLVPIAAARRMLRDHPTVYTAGDVPADPVAATAVAAAAKDGVKAETDAKEQERLAEVRDTLNGMQDKASLIQFIEQTMGHAVPDKRKSLADLKAHATMLVDQYGVPSMDARTKVAA
jgi:thioredoxin reductase